MNRRNRSVDFRQWRALRRLARRTQEATCRRRVVAQEIERMVRQAHRRLTLSASTELLPAVSGMENRLYALFAD
jgi:hypothetical protein